CGQVFGLGLYGVDIVEGVDGPWIVDVNTFPGYKGAPGAAARIADYIADYALGRRVLPEIAAPPRWKRGVHDAPAAAPPGRRVPGLSMALRVASVNALTAGTGGDGERQVASALAWYQTAKSLAGQLSKSAAGFLLSLTGANYSIVFLVAVGLSVLAALVVARFVPDDPREARAAPRAGAPAGPATTPAERPRILPFMGLGFLINATADMLD